MTAILTTVSLLCSIRRARAGLCPKQPARQIDVVLEVVRARGGACIVDQQRHLRFGESTMAAVLRRHLLRFIIETAKYCFAVTQHHQLPDARWHRSKPLRGLLPRK